MIRRSSRIAIVIMSIVLGDTISYWRLTNGEVTRLFGNVTQRTRLRGRLRIAELWQIRCALPQVYSDRLARTWVRRANHGQIFGGEAPLAFMLKGGDPAIAIVKKLLLAQRAGY